ncbi:MAG: Asp-tRNA(Asn)/Glu-tRNA(Gln) amidotransferase subunit GatA, partial [Simkaniaceae bacterium]|nr:Asp-tRNA(Asn)/Glu-tRNA(Gln) amidotransferase subunit GatA [Simkaniaceae bacterium]
MYNKTAKQLRDAVHSGELTATAIATYFLERTKTLDHDIGAYIALHDNVLEQAKRIDEKKARGESLGKLAGVPIGIKDNINIKGETTTCASKFLENYNALFDATVITSLRNEDAIFMGKMNMDEFAMGSATETSAFLQTRNPWATDCVAGGSSGGPAAGVAARFCPLSLGSDTGGSIRQPASYTGTYGFKPTYGRVSRYGLVAFGSSLDCIGPFANSIEDIALCMEVLANHCSHDATSLSQDHEPFLDRLNDPIGGKKVGVPWHLFDDLHGEIRDAFLSQIERMKERGIEIVDVDLKMSKYAIPVYYIISTAEASTNLARFDGVQYTKRVETETLDELYDLSRDAGFGSEVKKRILLGTYVLASGYQDAFYNKARKVRTLVIDEFNAAFKKCDVIALPTAPTLPFPHGSIVDAAEMH